MRLSVLLSFFVLACGLAACGGSSTAEVGGPVTGTAPAGAGATSGDVLVLELSTGTVKIKLRPDLAPQHVARVKQLAGDGFYNGIIFHRVIPGFMAQTGDPTGTGSGGSGKNLKAEFSAEPHVRGVCSMARSSMPNSANSQFFIVFDDAKFLDRQYTVWGKVIEGMEAVDQLARGEPPRSPDKMISVRVAADVA